MGPRLPAILVLCVGLGACALVPRDRTTTEPDPILRPVVDRLSKDKVRIRWPEDTFQGAVTVFAGLAPDAIDRSRPLAMGTTPSVTLTASDSVPEIRNDRRAFFELVPESGDSIVTAERRLPLERMDNFRDLGGYRTTDGRTVRWNRFYRSNDLAKLTASDYRYLRGMDLQIVCDLRTDDERTNEPDRRIEAPEGEDPELRHGPRQVDLPVEQMGVVPDVMRKKIRTGGITALSMEESMLAAYRGFVTENSSQWAALFQRISRPENLPAVVHCTVGKDRTGFAAALVLLSLGVPQETVFEDYLSTNFYDQDFQRFVLRWAPIYSFFRTDPEDLLPLLEARREYLQASLDTINEHYGTVDAYLETELAVTPELRQALRANLLR